MGRQRLTLRRPFLVFVALLCVSRAAWPQGTPLGPEFRVNTYTTGYQLFPSVAADSAGNFVVVWTGAAQDGSSYGIFGQRYASSGAPLGPEFRVNTFTTGSQLAVSVSSAPSGDFDVVWSSQAQDGSLVGVFGQRYASTGTPLGPEFRVNTYTTGSQNQSSLAVDGVGNFVVVWRSQAQDGSTYGVFGQRYASSGIPLGPEFRVNTFTTGIQDRPNVASDASGNFVVVWQSDTQDGSGFGVFGQRYASSGALLGPEFRVNTFTAGYQGYPAVAADPSGNFVVVWMSAQDGSSYGTYGQRYASSGAPLGPEFRVNSFTTGVQGYPVVAVDATGNFVVAWMGDQQDGSGTGILGQRYAASGVPLGPEFQVNTYTTGAQFIPAVAADPAGDFVVVWTSDLEDGSAFGVFGQRYGPIVPVELMRFIVE